MEQKSAFRFDYHGPSGTVLGSFVRKSSDPASSDYNKFGTPLGGSDADLDQTSSTTMVLKFHGSQSKYVFTDNAPDSSFYMTAVKDRSDNQISIAYAGTTTGSKPKMSTITDSSDRTYPVTYTGDYITKIANTATDPGLREWKYGYTGGYLTAYTDPEGATTTYGYTDVTSGPDLLTSITAPVNDSGAAPRTDITYGANDGHRDCSTARCAH